MLSGKLNAADLNIGQLTMKGLIPALMTSLLALPAMAADQYNDRGRVLSVTAQTERVNVPRQECRTEYQQQSYSEQQSYRDGNRSIAGTVIGGIAGGLLGSTIGRGNGRVAAAAVGAGIGAITGDRLSNRGSNTVVTSRTVPVQNCYQVDNWQTVQTGYLVTYEYNGRNYSTVTNNHPGRYIDVNVAVSPSNQVMPPANYIETIQYNGSDWDSNKWDNDRNDRRGNGWRKDREHRREGRGYY